jgi:2-dehydro-3-deoxy-D-gluconate 5-dehydrogenase
VHPQSDHPPNAFDGKVALITGGAGAIGRATARALLDAGAAAVAIAVLPEEAEQARRVVDELDATGTRVRPYDLDVRSTASIDSAVNVVCSDFERLDLLVNGAGVRAVASSLEMNEAEWDDVVSVNLRGVFFCAQAAARRMRAGGGAIVNIASQLGLVAAKDRAAYGASKAGVIHLTRSLALDWAPYSIRVNAVAPGPTRGPATPVAQDAQSAVEFLSRMPLGRPIEPEEVAHAIVYLSGPHAAATTGQTLVLDGGWTLS